MRSGQVSKGPTGAFDAAGGDRPALIRAVV
jgi:hypothetical protein